MADASLSGDARIPADLPAADLRTTELPEALQVPTRKVGVGFRTLFLLANIVTWLAKFPFTQIGWRNFKTKGEAV